jgi:hypothetical protein
MQHQDDFLLLLEAQLGQATTLHLQHTRSLTWTLETLLFFVQQPLIAELFLCFQTIRGVDSLAL